MKTLEHSTFLGTMASTLVPAIVVALQKRDIEPRTASLPKMVLCRLRSAWGDCTIARNEIRIHDSIGSLAETRHTLAHELVHWFDPNLEKDNAIRRVIRSGSLAYYRIPGEVLANAIASEVTAPSYANELRPAFNRPSTAK